jgi:hypothetical protein
VALDRVERPVGNALLTAYRLEAMAPAMARTHAVRDHVERLKSLADASGDRAGGSNRALPLLRWIEQRPVSRTLHEVHKAQVD